MVTVPVTISNLRGYFPHANARTYQDPIVLDGRNFAWDMAGPYSAFASRYLVDSTAKDEAPSVTQSLTFASQTYIATQNHLRYIDSEGDWATLHTFSAIPSPFNVPLNSMKWTYAFLGNKEYVCHPLRGIYRIDAGPSLTDISGITGMPSDVIAIGETGGRMLYLTETHLAWSAGNDAEDLTPAIAGPGFQVLGARIAGTPFALTTLSDACIIWTDQGALVAEFIGGNNVFRFDQLRIDTRPLNAFAIQRFHDGSFGLATKQGLYRLANDASLQELTPEFNVFLQEQWRVLPAAEPMLFYSDDDDHLYVALRDTTATFNQTYVLHLTLDKWGRFSSPHLGFFKSGRGRDKIAYTDAGGVMHRLLPATYQSGERDGPNGPVGLDSYIEIGYIRPPELVNASDSLSELYSVQVYRPPTAPVSRVDEGLVSSGADALIDEGLVTSSVTVIYDESREGLIRSSYEYGLIVYGDNYMSTEVNGYATLPVLSAKNAKSDLWTCIAGANFFRIKLEATEAGQFFQLTTMECTIATLGRQA